MKQSKYDHYYKMKDKRINYMKSKIEWDAIILKTFFILTVASFILLSFINFLTNRGT